MAEDERQDTPQDEPGADQEEPKDEAGTDQPDPAAEGDPKEPVTGDEDLSTTEDAAEEVTGAPEGEEQPAAEAPAGEEQQAEAPEGEEQPPEAREQRRPPRGKRKDEKKDEVIPGEHLSPDLVLEEERAGGEFDEFADAARFETPTAEAEAPEAAAEPAAEALEVAPAEEPAEQPEPRSAVELAADARYQATGKRKTSVARVILRPGDGAYSVNGRSLEDYFPRAALQKAAREPLTTAGFERRMDVVARIHGGGISSQAGAVRHGVARALVEADPSLRVELKRRGFLSRDARAKERKKAGLKKARKRPQFSKR